MAKKKKKEEAKVVGQLGLNGEIAPYSEARVLGRVDDKGNRTPFIQQTNEIAPVKSNWINLDNFKDGYDFGDITGTILGTGTNLAQNFVKGTQSNLEGFIDTGANYLSMGTEKLGMKDTTKKLRDFAQKDFIAENDLVNKTIMNVNPVLGLLNQGLNIKNNLSNGYDFGDILLKNNQIANTLGKKSELSENIDLLASNTIAGENIQGLAQTVGQIGGQAALGSIGLPWQITAFTNSAGNEMNNAFQNNATSSQAFVSGLISGIVEVGTEYIGGGANRLLGMESLGSKSINKLGSKIGNKVIQRLVKMGIDGASEGLEEVLSGYGTAIGRKLTYMSDKELKELYTSEEALNDFIMGALGSIVANVPGEVQSIRRGENAFSGLTENEQKVLDAATNNAIEEAQKDGKKLTEREKTKIRDNLEQDLQRGYISADLVEQTIGNNYNASKDMYLNESFNERDRKSQTYQNDVSKYDEKQRKTIQTAIDSGLLNNSNKTHDFVDLIAKISADKGVDFDFTNNERINETGFGIKGKTVNGYVKDGVINLNLESNQALNKTVGHEITHVLEGTEVYQELQNSLRSYLGEKEWNNRIKDLSETYKNVENANIENELTSDLVGDYIFNDESFVRNLSTNNQNLFQKIYDEIKYLVKVATAGSKQARELEKAKRMFEKAYRETQANKNTSSIETNAKIKKAAIETRNKENKANIIKEEKTSEIAPKKQEKATKKKQTIIPTKTDITNNENINKIKEKYDTANKITGSNKSVILNDGEKLSGTYKLIEAGEVTPSHNSENFTKSENFPTTEKGTTINDRDYENDKNAQQLVIEKAQNYDGRAFNDNGVIVTKDGIVVSGNDRTMAGEIAARNNTDQAYIDYLKENASQYGFTVEQIESMDHPRVVLELNDDLDYDTQTFAKFNKESKKTKSITEKAKELGKTIDNDTIDRISNVISEYDKIDDVYNSAKASRELLDVLLNKGIIDNNEVSQVYDGNKFTGAGKDLIEATVLGSVISEDNLKFFRNNNDLKFKMMKAAPSIIENKSLGDYSIIDEINNAIEVYKNAQQAGMTVEELNNQTSLFGDSNFDLITKRIAETLEKRGFRNFLNFVSKYNLEATAPANGQVDIFTGEIPSKQDVLTNALNIDDNTDIVSYSLSEDNQGRKLSQEQQEYFKDSKVRDENGNLQVVYKAEFGGDNSNVRGFFTKDLDLAKYYQNYFAEEAVYDNEGEIKETYLNIKNPLIIDAQENDYQNVPFEGKEYWTDELVKIAKERNYDGLIIENVLEGDDVYGGFKTTDYVTFNENQAKSIDNTNPTSNQDIRYSLTDNQGRQLSEQQQEYFKDSKVRDENGNLKVMYHGTPYGGFTVFSDINSGSIGDSGYFGKGYYFTDSKQLAEDYSDANFISPDERTTNAGEYGNVEVKEVYLDVKNPYIIDGKKVEYEMGNLEKLLNTSDPFESTEKLIEQGYDGVIYKGTDADEITVFNPNQIKNVDNTNPTSNPDIRYQLGNNEVAPTNGWNVRSEDVRLQSAFQDTIAPLQEQVQELSNSINELRDNIAPLRAMNEEEANEYAAQTQEAFENEVAPIRNNLTQEESDELNILERLDNNNRLNEENKARMDELQRKENNYVEEEMSPVRELDDVRDINKVSSPKVKAYQYEHPEVKPYFQQEARVLLNELNNTTKGYREARESTKNGEGFNWEWSGTKRITSPELADILDGSLGTTYKYDEIRKGLNAIIEDHGAENIAVAKRLEFVLDKRLREGYDAWGVFDENGNEYHVEPNSDYLSMLRQQEWENYFEDIDSQYPLEQNIPQYNLEDEETDFSDVEITPDIQDMTTDDINVEPFLEGLKNAADRQAERQQLREELNQKREINIPRESNFRKSWNRFKSYFVNEFAVVDDYAKTHNAPEIKHKTDTWNNYLATAQYNIENAQTDITGKAIGRSGNSIFQEAESLGLKDIFDDYLKHWANVDRAKQGKGANYEAQESYKIVKQMEAKNPELKRLGKDMWQYYRNARHNLRDAGIISQEVSDMLGRMYPHYTPYVSENIGNYFTDTGELKPKSTIKRAKGGAILEGLLSAEEAMQMYTKSQFNTIFGNDAFRSIVNTSNNQVQLGGDDRGMQFVNADNLYADKDGYYLTAYENGEPITAKISEEMYRTLSRETKNRVQEVENTFKPVGKVLSTLSNIRRNILTSWSPTFIAKNFIKDYQEALFNSKYTADFAKNYPMAFKELATNTGDAQQFKALYGSGLTMGQFDADSETYNPNAKNKNFLKGIKNANELIELAPRYAEFKASLENGTSLQEAMYNAREVTTNFSRGGVITKAANKYGMTFLNSSVQGFDKFVRNFSGENGAKGIVNSLAKAVMFGIAPAVFNELAFGTGDDKDEEYEALPDYIKDNYYIIKTGNGNFIRIPKGRVFSVFGSAARRTIEAMEGEENAFEGFLENAQQQIGINNPEENNIFAPFIQAMGGRRLDSGQTAGSAWYGGDIIPSRLQKERPEDQYDASIDILSIWLGQQTGISPYKINYVLDQYSGGIGDLVLPTITPEANSDGSIIAPIKDQFTADTITDNKYVSEFYDTKGKLYTGSKATDEDVLKNKYMNSISSEMAKLYAERREVQASDLSKEEKYKKSQSIKAEINRLAKEGIDNYNNIIMSNNYAKIGDTEYYKNANGTWTKTTDEVASLGLDTDEKSEYYKVKNDIYTTKKNNDGNDKPLVIQDIVNSNLTPDAKVSLYTSNYKDDLITPMVDLGTNVDSYLEYKAQNFVADKDDNGKSISGSKKRKVFDYINSMNIPYEQKLILAKSEYNTFNENNPIIIEYIENSGMEYDERIELYKQLGFKVDGNNISW